MANARKKLAKAIKDLDTYPAEASGNGAPKSLAAWVVQAHEALIDAIEEEQKYRTTKHFFKRNQGRYGSLGSMSNYVLDAYKGWAYRVVDSGRAILDSRSETTQDADVLSALLTRARSDLLDNRYKFVEPARESLFSLALKAAKMKLKKSIQKSAAKVYVPDYKPSSDWTSKVSTFFADFKGLPEQTKQPVFDPHSPITNDPACVALKPEESGVNGVELVVSKKCDNKICDHGYVYGERWGSEDYPCPKCNADKYQEWVAKNHPDEVRVFSSDLSDAEIEKMVADVKGELKKLTLKDALIAETDAEFLGKTSDASVQLQVP
jgi:hypothetical protein